MEALITIGQLLLGLSILVALHELGHFLPAKLFGMRVEKFFLFFDWPYALVKKKIGETTYGIGSLPFGGYVKISGMIDESMDKEQKERMLKPAEPWEFRAKPVWQRLIVMVGGVTVNVLLGFAIYSMVLFVWGRGYLPLENVKYGIAASELMKKEGFRNGDHIVAVPGHDVESLQDVSRAILIKGARTITIERDGVRQDIQLSENIAEQILDSNQKVLFSERFPFYIDKVEPGANAEKARSFRPGDRVLGVDGAPAPYFQEFVEAVNGRKGEVLDVTVVREGHVVIIPVKVGEDGTVGLWPRDPKEFFTMVKERHSFLASIPAGISFGWERMKDTVSSYKLLGSKSGLKQMGGLGAMAKAYGPEWVWSRFWEMTAFLSMALAFLNILPIPALDGGHVVFLLYEAVARRPASQKVLEYAQMAGFAFLLTVLVAVNGNDLYKWITDSW